MIFLHILFGWVKIQWHNQLPWCPEVGEKRCMNKREEREMNFGNFDKLAKQIWKEGVG